MSFNSGMWDWFEEVRDWKKGKPNYSRTLSVVMLDHISTKQLRGEIIPFEVWSFDIIEAFPSSWQGAELDANNDEYAYETITIQHGGITKAKSLISGDVADVVSLFQR